MNSMKRRIYSADAENRIERRKERNSDGSYSTVVSIKKRARGRPLKIVSDRVRKEIEFDDRNNRPLFGKERTVRQNVINYVKDIEGSINKDNDIHNRAMRVVTRCLIDDLYDGCSLVPFIRKGEINEALIDIYIDNEQDMLLRKWGLHDRLGI